MNNGDADDNQDAVLGPRIARARGDSVKNKKTETEVLKSSKEQLLRNPNIKPTGDVIAKALGEANNAYVKFVKELANRDIQLEWRYYTDSKAWLAKGLYRWTGVRVGQNEMTVFWMSIWDNFFKATIYIPAKSRADIINSTFPPVTAGMYIDKLLK